MLVFATVVKDRNKMETYADVMEEVKSNLKRKFLN